MIKEDWYPLIILYFAILVGIAVGAGIKQYQVTDHWKTLIHNAHHTGDKITVDGIDYRVIVMPEPVELQAHRSEYARRCQAITGKFFEGVKNGTNR